MLCSESNHTFIILNLMFKETIDVTNRNEISGILRSCSDYILIRKSKYRKCSDKFSSRLDNSHTGILGKLQNREVDLYLKGESRFDENEKCLHQTSSMIKTEKLFLIIRIILLKLIIFYFIYNE